MKHLDLNEEKILDYLSGEMNDDDSKIFESGMETNELLRREVCRLREVQANLRSWEDIPVSVPSIDELLPQPAPYRIFSLQKIPVWLKVAASVLLIIAFGWLTDLQLKKDGNAFVLSFGPQSHKEEVRLAQIEEKIDRMILDYPIQVEDKIRPLFVAQKNIQEQLGQVNQRAILEDYKSQLDLLGREIASFESRQMGRFNELKASLGEDQINLLQEFYVSSMQYMEDQRKADLARIEEAFLQLNETLNLQQFENDKLLSNLLTSNNY